MTEDRRYDPKLTGELFARMQGILQDQEIQAASIATMNMLANIIASGSPTLKEAKVGVQKAAKNLELIVEAIWRDREKSGSAS
jgi:hypothetical protein